MMCTLCRQGALLIRPRTKLFSSLFVSPANFVCSNIWTDRKRQFHLSQYLFVLVPLLPNKDGMRLQTSSTHSSFSNSYNIIIFQSIYFCSFPFDFFFLFWMSSASNKLLKLTVILRWPPLDSPSTSVDPSSLEY